MPHNDRVVLALDLKGAFDNVKHSVILEHLSETHCGKNTFHYIKDFLSHRTALIRIQNDEYGRTLPNGYKRDDTRRSAVPPSLQYRHDAPPCPARVRLKASNTRCMPNDITL